ncbi:hypothetical protein ABIF93_005796 [Bradyrhizobium japonicum]
MPTKQRSVKIFRIVEGEAEGRFAISIFMIIALASMGLAMWGFRSDYLIYLPALAVAVSRRLAAR